MTYDSSIKQLKDICDEINSYIISSNDFISNDLYKTLVRVEKFSDSSIDILVSTFTNTNDWDKYLKIKEDLIYSIKNVVELNKVLCISISFNIHRKRIINILNLLKKQPTQIYI